MEKLRVYELAKELNTTSKRLIEKLEEINITVKNHMSLLDEEQLKKLYDHIGFKKNLGETDNADGTDKTSNVSSDERRSNVRDIPQIIRKTRIIIETKEEKSELPTEGSSKASQRSSVRSQSNTGLRPGFVYDANRRDIADSKGSKEVVHSTGTREQKKIDVGEDIKKGEKIEHKTVSSAKDAKKTNIRVQKTEESVKKSEKQSQKSQIKSSKTKQTSNKKPVVKDEATAKKTQTTQESKKGIMKDKDKNINKEAVKNAGRAIKDDTSVKTKVDLNQTRDVVQAQMRDEDNKRGYDKFSGKTNRAKIESLDDEMQRKGKDASRKSNLDKYVKFDNSKIADIKKNPSALINDDFSVDEVFERQSFKKKKKVVKTDKEKNNNIDKHIPPKAVLTHVVLPEQMTVKELAETLKKTAADVIKKLIGYGIMATINQVVDYDIAALVADEYGITVEKQVTISEEDILFDDSEDRPEELVARPPVVVVMGHVDHGKTSLLDAIRKTDVTQREMGGITQHIGAYLVEINKRKITFLDTPGHEAFTAMRARGAQVTDIAVLVVAADDGVMPQTIEAINHAKAANVSIIVAINKVDKPEANPDKIKQDLTEYGLVAEEWGGDTIFVPVSAKYMQNIDGLLEMILLVADVLELKANPNRQAKGTVIEARLDKNKGPLATLLVQRGTLKAGDSIVAGTTVGRIRAMSDDKGNAVKSAGPSTPVEVLGFSEVPEAGEIFYAVTDEKVAKHLVEKRKLKQREETLMRDAKISLDDLFNQIQQGNVKELNIIVKADVQGSVEAVEQALEKLSNDDVKIKIIHGGVGAITESDVKLAEVSNAIITGFNVRPAQNVMEIANNLGVDVRLYRVIYNAIEDIQAAMKGMLDPKYKEVVLGHAEIRQLFKISSIGMIAGCYVTDGKISRNSDIRVVRGGIVIHEGRINSLQRHKDDVKEVAQGFECGINIEKFNDIKEGDIIEAFEMQEVES